jgi:hypothetical protein
MVPDMMLIQSAITNLKTAAEIAKGFVQLKSEAEVQGKVVELQQVILSAQTDALAAHSQMFGMIQQIGDLKKELARVKAWEEEKQRYH